MSPEKVALTAEKETLLITLYAKGEESRLPDSLLHDRFAAEAIGRLDYDFAKLQVNRDDMVGLAMRADILDGWTRSFIAAHPDAVVLHLGCGLDTRVFRVDPPPGVLWFDVDYPEVAALRGRLYPERDGYAVVGASVVDPAWLDEVPADRPTMIVAEGLLMYLGSDQVPRLLERLTTCFPGGELAFDAFSRLGVKLVQRHRSLQATGASLGWSIEEPEELVRQVPRLRLIKDLTASDSGGYDPEQVARMSWSARMTVRVLSEIPSLARISRLLHFRF